MSQGQEPQNGQTPEDSGSFRVSDPEEYNQTQRLRAINQARQRVEDTIGQSMVRQVTDSSFDEEDRQQVIRAELYSYLTNIEWSMADSGERYLLEEQPLGAVVLEPPDRFQAIVGSQDKGHPRVIGSPDLSPYKEPINGIQDYLTAPEVFEYSWTVQIEERHSEPKPVTRTRETYMPIHISKNAFRAANKYLSNAGMDVETVEVRGDHGFDYSDILEEGARRSLPPSIDMDGSDQE